MTQPKKSVAELPSGGPTNKGLPLDSGIPGASTFTKPVSDIRKPETEDESIHRVDDANSISKDRDRVDTVEDNADQNTSYNGLGDSEATSKTKYPYRDGVPNAHNASFVAEMWKLEGARSTILRPEDRVKSAATVDEILDGLDAKFQQRAKKCTASLKRADIGNLRWIFSVDCGNGPKAVKLRALVNRRARQFSKLDIEVSCSCPAWQWLGPEYHAKGESFILGKNRGTAAPPDIRDPERDNRVCKHVAAALAITRNWALPKTPLKVKKALTKASRMRKALRKASHKRDLCVKKAAEIVDSGDIGYVFSWEGAPHSIHVRARAVKDGLKYQYRREGTEKWPYQWLSVKDPAAWVQRLGLGNKWSSLSAKLREQLLKVV